MDVRVDAAGDHDLAGGVDRAPGAQRGEAAGGADRGDALALDADIGLLRAGRQNGKTAGDHGVEQGFPPSSVNCVFQDSGRSEQPWRRESEAVEDLFGCDVVHDEDEPAAVIGIRPIVEPFRREHRMLSGLYDSWAPGPVGELDNALDAQQIVAAITRQPAESAGKIEPGRRLVQLQCEDADAVAVRMLARGKPPPVLGSAADLPPPLAGEGC